MSLLAWLFCRHKGMYWVRNVIVAGNGESHLKALWYCPGCTLIEYREIGPSEAGGEWLTGTIPCPACGCRLIELNTDYRLCPLCLTPRTGGGDAEARP